MLRQILICFLLMQISIGGWTQTKEFIIYNKENEIPIIGVKAYSFLQSVCFENSDLNGYLEIERKGDEDSLYQIEAIGYHNKIINLDTLKGKIVYLKELYTTMTLGSDGTKVPDDVSINRKTLKCTNIGNSPLFPGKPKKSQEQIDLEIEIDSLRENRQLLLNKLTVELSKNCFSFEGERRIVQMKVDEFGEILDFKIPKIQDIHVLDNFESLKRCIEEMLEEKSINLGRMKSLHNARIQSAPREMYYTLVVGSD